MLFSGDEQRLWSESEGCAGCEQRGQKERQGKENLIQTSMRWLLMRAPCFRMHFEKYEEVRGLYKAI